MEEYLIQRPEYIKKRKRVGCGPSSGHGKTCGRGANGQKSRSGSTRRPWFEGGQMPLIRRIPKRGFNNIFKKDYQIVNVNQLEKIDSEIIDPSVLKQNGLIQNTEGLIKILGHGDLLKTKKVFADKFSQSAIEKITKLGGEIHLR